jgi:hypothetical protein
MAAIHKMVASGEMARADGWALEQASGTLSAAGSAG